MSSVRPRYRTLTERELLHLVRLASGLLKHTAGDLNAAMSLAIRAHADLLTGIRDRELRADVGPGDAVLFVPDEGGLAIRVERRARPTPSAEAPPADEPTYPFDLLGFEVVERAGAHISAPPQDAGVDEDTWFDGTGT